MAGVPVFAGRPRGHRHRHRGRLSPGPDGGLDRDRDDIRADVAALRADPTGLVRTAPARLAAAAPPAAAPTPAHSLIQAHSFVRQAVGSAVGPLRDATMGYLAVLSGRASEAEALLRAAWAQCDPAADPDVAAVVAQRLALHGVGRLRGDEVVEWARRALELAAPDDPVRVEAEALLGLGLSWQGRLQEGVAAYEAVLARLPDDCGVQAERVRMAQGWLFLVADDLVTARALLARAAPAALRAGSVRIAVWSYVWLARAEFVLGAWDEAAV